MTVTHMLPELPSNAPTERFVQSNKIPTIEQSEQNNEELYLSDAWGEDHTITVSPGNVIHRKPPERNDNEVFEWPSGETWWYVTAVHPEQFIFYDLQKGVFRVWHQDKVQNDVVYNGYEYTVFNED